MNYFFVFFFSLYSALTFACSCEIPVYYCDYSKEVAAAEKGVILIGEYLATDTINDVSWAYQFKVLEIVRGEVEVGGLLNNVPEHVNTDSTIWFRGGQGATCLYSHLTEKVVISFMFKENGYNPSICKPRVLNIDENDIIQGSPWEPDFRLNVEDLDDFINGTCVSGTENVRSQLAEVTSIYPNPTADDLVIERTDLGSLRIDYTVFDLVGNSRCSGILDEKRKIISLREFPDGVYFLSLESDGVYYSERIVKASAF